MKLSKLRTDRAADVLCEMSVYLLGILSDEEFMGALRKEATSEGAKTRAEILAFGVEKIGTLIPMLLKKHRDDVFGLLAALHETTPEKIRAQNLLKTMAQIRDAFQDQDLLDFFRSCAREETA